MTNGSQNQRPAIDVAPNQAWEPENMRGAVRGRVIVRLAPGEVPDKLPSILAVTLGKSVAPLGVGNDVDSVVKRFSPALRVTTAFAAAKSRDQRQQWDDIEHATGLARTLRIDVDPDASLVDLVSALNDLAIVEQASPQYLSVTPFDRAGHDGSDQEAERLTADPYQAQEMIGATEAHSIEPGDTALIVAIVDSGVDLHHPELRERLRPGIDTVDLPANGVPRSMQLIGDWSGIDRQPQDYVGHGTACAGIIGARGELIPSGLAGAARMLAVRVLAAARMTGRPRVTALGAITDIDLGLKIAIDLGARVFNLSFGTPETALRKDDPRPHADIVNYARRRGCVLIAASGNSGDMTALLPGLPGWGDCRRRGGRRPDADQLHDTRRPRRSLRAGRADRLDRPGRIATQHRHVLRGAVCHRRLRAAVGTRGATEPAYRRRRSAGAVDAHRIAVSARRGDDRLRHRHPRRARRAARDRRTGRRRAGGVVRADGTRDESAATSPDERSVARGLAEP